MKNKKGFVQQIKESNFKETESNLTLDDFVNHLQGLFEDTQKQKRDVLGYRYCITQGWVEFGSTNLNLCSDPDCSSCKQLNELLKQEIERLPFKIKNDE